MTTAEFERTALLNAGVDPSQIPSILDTATFRRMLLDAIAAGGNTGGAVKSVAGKTGIVTLVKADVGLDKVDNTTDAEKPVSNATQSAISALASATQDALDQKQPVGNYLTSVNSAMVTGVIDNTKTTSFSLANADNGEIITINSSVAINVTIPSGLLTGFNTMIVQLGTGVITFVAGSGVTIRSFGGFVNTAGQNAAVSITNIAQNQYHLGGNLA